MKNYLALARVSSEEQEHGFCLYIQEDALREWWQKTAAALPKYIGLPKQPTRTRKGGSRRRNMKNWIDLGEQATQG